MKIYLDLVLLLNFLFDFLLLTVTSILLKRNVTLTKLLLGGFIGSLSILILFTNINSLQLFLIKIIISILMVWISFGFKNIRYFLKNLFFLYTSSMILGGFLYFLNVEFSYKQEGLVFYHNGLSVNVLFLIIFSPIILYTYIKQIKQLKNNYTNYYKVDIYINKKIVHCNAFLDTGNKLTDPYFKKPIILVKKEILTKQIHIGKPILVPFSTINGKGLIKCLKVDKILIKGVGEKKKLLVGLMEEEIKIDGVECILNTKLWEE